MVEFLWTFGVQEVLKKTLIIVAEQISVAREYKKVLQEVQKELIKAQRIVNAITTQRLNHNSQDGLVTQWLNDLQLIVNEAEDMLDLFIYEHLQQQVNTADREIINKVPNFLRTLKPSLVTSIRSKKMKEIIDVLSEHCAKLPLLLQLEHRPVKIAETEVGQIRETISKPEDYVVERKSVVDQVIDASKHHHISILPVFGMGGLGKTTLAKLVFNHERIKDHFDFVVWIYVSEPFVINNILQAILQKLEDHPSDCTNNREVLLEKLTKTMTDKTYFLVLDDVWNNSKILWEKLKECLMSITEQSGNSILVTTRSSAIAKMMEQNIGSHDLSKLSDDQCWSIFRNFANANEVSITSSLEVVQKQLVRKIGGLPLLAKVLGATVQFSGDNDQWVANLKSVLTTPLKEEEFDKFALMLSVDRLANASIKQCFAHCSNFSKGYEIDKKQVIQMWMAQGFTQPDEGSNETMEDTGERYFDILLSCCLFQDVVRDERGRIEKFRMHDLIHDIACRVSNDKKLKLDHIISSDWKQWTNEDKVVMSKLRTVNFNDYNHMAVQDWIQNFACLRVLIIGNYIKELPNSISKLKHLRYLDISYCSSIEKLPKSIVHLYNLQTLRFYCLSKGFLPNNVGEMVSLRHLEFSLVGDQMAQYLSQLIQLQTLSKFVVGFEKGFKITELGALRNLRGLLKLLNLERVESKEEAKSARLLEKENLQELHLLWRTNKLYSTDVHHNDLEVLEGLQPHKNLRYLKIELFLGRCFPYQIFVENLVQINLLNCTLCEKLPTLGQLGNLEILIISRFKNLNSIDNEFYGNDSTNNQIRTLFPKLKEFHLNEMYNLVQWEEVPNNVVKAFPRLECMHIVSCTKLVKIPDLFGYCDENGKKHLEVVEISSCSELSQLPNGLQSCHSIQQLCLHSSSKLQSFVKTRRGPLADLLSRTLTNFFIRPHCSGCERMNSLILRQERIMNLKKKALQASSRFKHSLRKRKNGASGNRGHRLEVEISDAPPGTSAAPATKAFKNLMFFALFLAIMFLFYNSKLGFCFL